MTSGPPPAREPRAAYIHVPFCRHHCGYCNFTVVAGRDDLIQQYLAALDRELVGLGEARAVETMFIGGGTPTHLPPAALEQLLTTIRRRFLLAAGCEFTIEANPVDVSAEIVRILADHGVTRISLGAQSFAPVVLRNLERDHGPQEIVNAVTVARAVGLDLSLDLIFASPGQTMQLWQQDLEKALQLAPDHISTYGLTFERGTTFLGATHTRGDLAPRRRRPGNATCIWPRSDTCSAQADFEHYEVSNFALRGHRCRHNEVYWAGESYFAAGPGAARYVDGRRETNHRSTTTWLRRVLAGESPVAEQEMLDPEDRCPRDRLYWVYAPTPIAGVNAARRSSPGERDLPSTN